jgi:hypothetical protein
MPAVRKRSGEAIDLPVRRESSLTVAFPACYRLQTMDSMCCCSSCFPNCG